MRKINYYIITTGRTGSTLLCGYLKQLGFGHVNGLADDKNLPSDQRSLDGLKKNIEARRNNNYCGVKVSWSNIYWIDKHIQPVTCAYSLLYDLLEAPHFIYLHRHDIVGQAISMTKHIMLDRFHIRKDTDREEYKEMESALANQPVPHQKIASEIINLWKNDRAWELFFEHHNIQPLRISFKNFLSDKVNTLEQISAYLQKPQSVANIDFHDKTQSVRTNINNTWQKEILSKFFTDFF